MGFEESNFPACFNKFHVKVFVVIADVQAVCSLYSPERIKSINNTNGVAGWVVTLPNCHELIDGCGNMQLIRV
jgi:hypothetical protein